MTETNMTGDVAGQHSGSDSSTVLTPAPAAPAPAAERMVAQSKVDEIAHQANRRGYEKAVREQQERYQQSNQQSQANGSTWNQNGQGLGGMAQQQYSAEDIRRIVAEENQKFQREAMGQHTANSFLQKLNNGIQKNPAMRESLSQIQYETIPQIVEWANQLPNTAEVMHDLADNPDKLVKLKTLLEIAPRKAQSELQKLSDSISTNNHVAMQNAKPVREPLSQVSPSYVGLDNGQMTVADWKRKLRS